MFPVLFVVHAGRCRPADAAHVPRDVDDDVDDVDVDDVDTMLDTLVRAGFVDAT
jgi:hypothetical protein